MVVQGKWKLMDGCRVLNRKGHWVIVFLMNSMEDDYTMLLIIKDNQYREMMFMSVLFPMEFETSQYILVL